MRRLLKNMWQSLKIKHKIRLYTDIVLIIILLSIFLAAWAIKSSLLDFSVILKDNSLVSDFVQCMEKEAALFENYAKTGKEDVYEDLEGAVRITAQKVAGLPYDYQETGAQRYAKTWSILNMYRVYCDRRDGLLAMEDKISDDISSLYEVYEIQSYLLSYSNQLMRMTLEDGRHRRL